MKLNWNIIKCSICSKISEQENALLERWLSEDIKHAELYHDAKKFYTKENCKIELTKEDIDFKLAKFVYSKKRNVKRLIRISAVAASIAITISIFSILNYLKQDEIVIVSTLPPIEVVSSDRVLFQLEDGDNFEVAENSTIVISDEGIVEQHRDSIKKKIIKKSIFKSDSTIHLASVTSPSKDVFFITLSDKTKVWLNSNTKLTFPLKFNGSTREVYVVGEAYFEVAHDKNRPFIVKSNGKEVFVLGTKFNVKSRNNELFETTLVDGSVKVGKNDGDKVTLKPNEKGVIIDNDNDVIVSKVNVNDILSWKQGKIIFNNERLEDLLKRIDGIYSYTIQYMDDSAREERFVFYTPRDITVEDAISVISRSKKVRFEVEDKLIKVYKVN